MFKWIFGTYVGLDHAATVSWVVSDLWKKGYGSCRAIGKFEYKVNGKHTITLIAKDLRICDGEEFKYTYVIDWYGYLVRIDRESMPQVFSNMEENENV